MALAHHHHRSASPAAGRLSSHPQTSPGPPTCAQLVLVLLQPLRVPRPNVLRGAAGGAERRAAVLRATARTPEPPAGLPRARPMSMLLHPTQRQRRTFIGWYRTSLLSSWCMMLSISEPISGGVLPVPPPPVPPPAPPSPRSAPSCSASRRSISSAAGGGRALDCCTARACTTGCSAASCGSRVQNGGRCRKHAHLPTRAARRWQSWGPAPTAPAAWRAGRAAAAAGCRWAPPLPLLLLRRRRRLALPPPRESPRLPLHGRCRQAQHASGSARAGHAARAASQPPCRALHRRRLCKRAAEPPLASSSSSLDSPLDSTSISSRSGSS